METGDFANAQRAIRGAYKIDKENVLINYTYGIICFEQKLYKEAMDKFDYVLSKNKENRHAFFKRLECLIYLNRAQEVIDFLDKLEDKDSEEIKQFYVKAYTRLACIEPSYYNIEEARKHITEYKEKYPDGLNQDAELKTLTELETKIGE